MKTYHLAGKINGFGVGKTFRIDTAKSFDEELPWTAVLYVLDEEESEGKEYRFLTCINNRTTEVGAYSYARQYAAEWMMENATVAWTALGDKPE